MIVLKCWRVAALVSSFLVVTVGCSAERPASNDSDTGSDKSAEASSRPDVSPCAAITDQIAADAGLDPGSRSGQEDSNYIDCEWTAVAFSWQPTLILTAMSPDFRDHDDYIETAGSAQIVTRQSIAGRPSTLLNANADYACNIIVPSSYWTYQIELTQLTDYPNPTCGDLLPYAEKILPHLPE